MTTFTLFDLLQLLRESADQDSGVAVIVDENNADRTFDELGFDSLAIFNVAAQIEERYSIQIGYDVMAETKSPRALFSLIQRRLAKAA